MTEINTFILYHLLGHNAQPPLQKETIPAAKNTLNIIQRVFA